MPTPRRLVLYGVSLLVGLLLATKGAAQPVLSRIEPPALQAGTESLITLEGEGLSEETRLLLPYTAEQEVQPGGNSQRMQIRVTVAPDVPSAIVPARVVGPTGASKPLPLAVDQLASVPWTDEISALPSAIVGRIAGNQKLVTRFQAQAGSDLVLDVQATRLGGGGGLRPTLRVLDNRGTQLAWSPPRADLGGDAQCALKIPGDGRYTVELHDELFRATAPAICRLRIGPLPFGRQPIPAAVQVGVATEVRLLQSNLPGETRYSIQTPADPLLRWSRLPHPTGGAWLNSPVLPVSPFPELAESSDGIAPPLPGAPVGVSGILSEPGESDVYRLSVTAGTKLQARVDAAALGSEIDGVLVVRAVGGGQLARGDDTADSTDPRVEFTVPSNISEVELVVSDLAARGGPGHYYRLVVEPAGVPRYTLLLDTDTLNVPAGGTALLSVRTARAGYQGPIHLSLKEIPEGVRLAGESIPPGGDFTLLSITASGESRFATAVSVVGLGDAPAEAPVVAKVAGAKTELFSPEYHHSAMVVSGSPAAATLSWEGRAAEGILPIGGELRLPVSLTRAAGVNGRVRLSLRTTQTPVTKKVKEGNQEKEVSDEERMLRLAEQIELPEESLAAELPVVVPRDLPTGNWGLVAVAELLSEDGRQVLHTAYTPTLVLSAEHSLWVTLSGSPMIEARAGDGDTGRLQGKLERRRGFKGRVGVTLLGLPEGYPAPRVELSEESTEFELEVRFPKEAKPAELKQVRLVAEQLETESPTEGRLTSNVIPVVLKVVAGN